MQQENDLRLTNYCLFIQYLCYSRLSFNAAPYRKDHDMANVLPTFIIPFDLSNAPAPRRLRWGARQVAVCRDFRTRFYRVRPLIDCRPGVEAGHLEVLFFRKWLLILSKAR